MIGRRIAVIACLLVCLVPAVCLAGGSGASGSAYLTKLIHKENCVTSSVLYIPYMIFQIPIRLIDGIINPVPTSQATSPPQAHRAPPY